MSSAYNVDYSNQFADCNSRDKYMYSVHPLWLGITPIEKPVVTKGRVRGAPYMRLSSNLTWRVLCGYDTTLMPH